MDGDKYPKTIVTAPGDMEMSRTDEAPIDENDPLRLSLSEKLKNHYNKGVKKQSRTLDNAMTPQFLNRTGVPMFLFTWVATMKIGVFDVMPLVHAGDDWNIFINQFIVLFMGSQMLLNWFGIRYWISSYNLYKKRFGEDDSKIKDNILFQYQAAKQTQDSSSAVLMPLVKDASESEKTLEKNNQANIASKQDMERDSADDLTKEVEKANTEMKRRMDEENNGIRDLIGKKDTLSSSSNDRQAEALSVGGNTGHEQKEKIRTVTYPYWSWTPCYKCVTKRPPRCHHCDLCSACILKRDHHCYFAGSCVGYRNMRFFFIFLIWSFIGSMWATINGFPYIYNHLWDDMSYVDIVFFFAIVRWIFGYVSFQAALSVTTLSLLIYFDLITTMFIITHGSLIRQGITSFEKFFLKKSLVIQDTRSLGGKLRAVFGKNWIVMLFIPIHFFVEPEEDPVNWPHVKAIKN